MGVLGHELLFGLIGVTSQTSQTDKGPDGTKLAENIRDGDEWALEYINLNRLQAITEAFDDDGSGFVTIAEVNQFTASCPDDWRYVTPIYAVYFESLRCQNSLPHWLAYWAIGMQYYLAIMVLTSFVHFALD